MSHVKTQEAIQELRKHVQQLLDKRMKRRSYRLRVSPQWRQEDEWVYFVVTPTRTNIGASDFADALSDVESELRRDEKIEGVLLVPAVEG